MIDRFGACPTDVVKRPIATFGGHVSASEQDARLEFAQCIRDHGVEDFPDPTRNSPLVDTRRIPSAATDDGMTILNAAMQKCGDRAAEAMGQ